MARVFAGERAALGIVGTLVAGLAAAVPASAQEDLIPPPVTARRAIAPVPFGPGERLTYKVKWGIFNLGQGALTVEGIETVRGRPAYQLSMTLDGGRLGLTVKDDHDSWMDVETLSSLRFRQDIHEVNYKRLRQYEIYPDEGRWEQNNGESGETMDAIPLDDISFLYFARTLPLKAGDVYRFNRYFKESGNPVVLKVLRRETIEVPAGVFDTVVLQPTFQTSGMFSDGGEAELYFTDDERRLLVYMKTKLSIGNLTLHLEDIQTGRPLATMPAAPSS